MIQIRNQLGVVTHFKSISQIGSSHQVRDEHTTHLSISIWNYSTQNTSKNHTPQYKKNIYQRLPTTGPFQALEPFLCLTRPGPRAERNDFSVHKHLGRSAVTDGEVENGEVVKRNRGCLLMRNYMQIEKANDTTWKLRWNLNKLTLVKRKFYSKTMQIYQFPC